MSFIGNSIRNYCVNYFNFKGRTGRAEFWTITLILVVMSVLLNSLSSSLQTLFNLLTIIPTMAMVMRRANDSNLSKVVVVLYYVFSFMGVILILVSLSAVAAVTIVFPWLELQLYRSLYCNFSDFNFFFYYSLYNHRHYFMAGNSLP